MNSTVNFPIKFKTNENLKINLDMTDNLGTVLDLTGATVRMQIRETRGGDGALIWSKTDQDDEITLVEEEARIVVDIPITTVMEWDFTIAYYDVVLDYSEEDWDNILEGKMTASPGVTYPEEEAP